MAKPIDPAALEQLIREQGAALELFAAQWTTQPEDCVQDAFVKLAGQASSPLQPVPWLYRVVRNRAISMHRADQRRRRHETRMAVERPQWFTSSRWSAAELQEVTAALAAIDANLCEVVVARIWGDLPFEQIARVLNLSTSTAHRHYEAGLLKLRERLGVPWNKISISAMT